MPFPSCLLSGGGGVNRLVVLGIGPGGQATEEAEVPSRSCWGLLCEDVMANGRACWRGRGVSDDAGGQTTPAPQGGAAV